MGPSTQPVSRKSEQICNRSVKTCCQQADIWMRSLALYLSVLTDPQRPVNRSVTSCCDRAAAMLFSTGLLQAVVTELQQCCFQQACRKFRLVPSRFYKSGRAARSGRVEAHGKCERRKFSDWQITVIFLARKCFSCKLIFYAPSLDFLTLVYINRSFYDVVSAKCVFLSSISALNWSSLEYFKMADSDELRW